MNAPGGIPAGAEQVLADRYEAARRGGERAAGEGGEDAFLPGIERFVSHFLVKPAVDRGDVDAKLIRAVGARVGRQIAGLDRVKCEVRDLHAEVLAKQPEHDLVM